MLSTTHTIISITLANFCPYPSLVFIQAFVIHFVADKVLHWNFLIADDHKYPIIPAIADAAFGLLISWLIVGNQIISPVYIAAIVGGNLPDVMIGLWHIINPHNQKPKQPIIKQFHSFHDLAQTETPRIIPGLIPQIITVVICLLLITFG